MTPAHTGPSAGLSDRRRAQHSVSLSRRADFFGHFGDQGRID
jgi:hypothetical protein